MANFVNDVARSNKLVRSVLECYARFIEEWIKN